MIPAATTRVRANTDHAMMSGFVSRPHKHQIPFRQRSQRERSAETGWGIGHGALTGNTPRPLALLGLGETAFVNR